jgi:hypothetical protein
MLAPPKLRVKLKVTARKADLSERAISHLILVAGENSLSHQLSPAWQA